MSRATRITLICHGTTAAMRSSGFPADEPLIEGDVVHAGRINGLLRHARSITSAPELRTRQTAGALTPEFAIDSALRDLDCGRWAGLSLDAVQEEEPDGLMAWVSSVDAAPHGGESVTSLIGRVADWLSGQISAGGHAIAVTHPAVIRAAIVSILNAPGESFWKIDVQPWSVTELSSDGRRWALRSLGRLPD